ncbi:MAG: M28 family peptidase [Armatimonadetes bacterium]|nr:M28 family peptidase [Armatimonadota bacterium]
MIDLAQVSAERLMAHTRTLARWERWSGSAEELEAARYVAAELTAMGYATQLILHDAYIGLPGPASLRVTAPAPREIFCITHPGTVPTGPEGVRGELVDAGKGSAEGFVAAGAAGKIALVEGRARSHVALAATRAGVKGLICFGTPHAQEMSCAVPWGNPSESTVSMQPAVHVVSVHREDGLALRKQCAEGRVEAHFTAEVREGWTKTPVVIADLPPAHPEADAEIFVFFTGHLDSWYVGAMDNGGANAAMLECARLLAPGRARFRRGLRVAFWSGHSHGRYSSSAWYADNFWFALDRHCAVNVNVDSIGAHGADRFRTWTMTETADLVRRAVRQVAGADIEIGRVARAYDESFWGIGIPSMLNGLSWQEDGGIGWWQHTPYDTVDRMDPARLARDTRIYLLVLDRLLTDAVLPFDYAASAADIKVQLEDLQRAGQGRFDLAPAVEAAAHLERLCGGLNERVSAATGDLARARALNACLVDLGRILIPATYHASGRFAHDPALPTAFLPKLQPVRRLAAQPPESDRARLITVDLVRARNEVLHALRQAARRVESCLTAGM